MATRPDQVFLPRPVTLYDRVRTVFGDLLSTTGYRDGAAQARPLVDLNPVSDASPADPSAPVPLQGTYSRAYGGFTVDARWLTQLAVNDDSVLTREGGHDLNLYDALLDDDICASAFQQRRLAVISRPWEVEPGDDSPQAKEAADHLRDQLARIGWDRICDLMLYGRWYGYAVAELLYEVGPDGKIRVAEAIIPDRRIFAFTNAGELRLRADGSPGGEVLPANKFWAYRAGGTHDFVPYGVGLAHYCYWPVWFKKNVLKFWAVYLEKFGMPTTLGKFPEGASPEDRSNILAAASAVSSDRAIAIPETMDISLLAEGRSSSDSYLQFIGSMNDALLRVILSQTGTSKAEAQGLGGSQSETHKDIRDEVVRADSDMLHESFNRGPAKWLTTWNFGPDVAPPRVYRNLEDQEDLDSIATRDKALKELGWVRTEESFREVYGDAYEYTGPTPEERAAQRAALLEGAQPPQGGRPVGGRDAEGNVVDLQEERDRRQPQFSAEDLDTIETWADDLASGADPIVAEFAASLKGKLRNVTDADQLRVALLEGLEKFPTERLGELAGLPFVNARARAEAGLD